MSNSVPITRLPLDPELLGELIAGTQTKRDPPTRRAGVKRRKFLFTTKPRSLVAFER